MSEVIRLSRSNSDNSRTLNITLMLMAEVWEEELDGYTLDQPFTSQVRLAAYYSKGCKDLEDDLLTPGKMLCMLLKQLVCEKKLTFESIIALEADPSKRDALVKKVYEPMGFEFKSPSIVEGHGELCGGALMAATVGVICCNAQIAATVGDGAKPTCATCGRVYGRQRWGRYCTQQCVIDGNLVCAV